MSGPLVSKVRVSGLDLAYRIDGKPGAPVVMLAHGLLTSHRLWDAVVGVLGSEWQLLRYDLRGHGASGAIAGAYCVSQLAQDAIGLLDALEIPRVHFVGISLGGMIGQHLGAHHPSRLHTLTLANTTCMQPAAAVWQQRIDTATAQGLEGIVEASMSRWLTPAALASRPELVAVLSSQALKTSLAGFVGCASAVRDLSQRDLLRHVSVPTLVVAGEHDLATTPEESHVLVEEIPSARLATVAAAHQSVAECPDAFVRAWLDFQSELSRAGALN